ncbi:MAG: serine protease [Pseudomonadales bacterium]|nr:serine protease [Pseudomonadales bacterium]
MSYKKWTALLGLFTMLLSVSGYAAPGVKLADTIEAVKPSIVGIGTYKIDNRPPAKLAGTGFVVSDGRHLITNSHVIPNMLDQNHNEFLVAFVGVGNQPDIRRVELLERDTVHDLALLKMEGAALPALKIRSSKIVREGENYAFTGFPIGAVLGLYPVTHRGIISSITPIAVPQTSAGSISAKMLKQLRDPYRVFQLDATAYPGNSGSPMYHPETGRVVGVINKVFVKESKEAVLEKPSGISYAIPSRYVRELLEKHGLSSK